MDSYAAIFLLGRLLFGGFFLMSGFSHFKNLKGLAGYAGSKGVPMPTFAVVVAGILLLIGGLGIILGVYIEFAILALVLFLVPVTFMMHAFWKEEDPQKMTDRTMFMKNMALLGAALLIMFIVQPWSYSLPLGN